MTNQAIDSEALDWVVRLGDAAFDDWSAFQAWLEADPANASRYHALSADVDEMVGHAAKVNLPGVLSRPVGARKVGYLIGGALAASIAMLFVYATLLPPAKSYTVETAAGEMRSLDLADGSRITLSLSLIHI